MKGCRFALYGFSAYLLGFSACAPAAPPVEAPAPSPSASHGPLVPEPRSLTEEAEPRAPELRTGRIQPVDHSELLSLKVRRQAIDGDEQLLEVPLPEFTNEQPGDSFWRGTEVRISGSRAPFQLVGRGKGSDMVLWLRRPKSEAAAEIAGDAYTPALGASPGHHYRFRVPVPGSAPSPELVGEWALQAIDYLVLQGGAFGVAAANRLRDKYKLAGKPGALQLAASSNDSAGELAELMDTFTARSSVQAALAVHRNAVLSANKQPRSIPIAQLHAPQLARHPWAPMSQRLGVRVPDEPLAKAVPADFYFVRAQSFDAFTEVLSVVEKLGAPAADLLDATSVERGSLPRYLAELGVETGDLSRVLGPKVVHDFAVTGSDPYIHEGSDVTLIFRLKSPLLFRAALLKSLTVHGSAHGGTQSSQFNHGGVTVDVARSADGRVRQHRAVVGDFELVSNSPAAIRRVISTIQGKAPALADEPDFRYMLARDAEVPAEVLGFIGDRFVASVVSPAQKLAEARRQLALSELTAAPVAALVYGWVRGKSPTDRNELVRSGLLAASELAHSGGAPIAWAPGEAPRSAWGTPASLEPLIDLPTVTTVSAIERDGYARFARDYEGRWSEYIDPIALRLSSSRHGGGNHLHAELRVLPLVPAEEALRWDLGDDGRVAPAELASGARFSIGIGSQARLRSGLMQAMNFWVSREQGLSLEWLGDYAMVGCADRGELLKALHASDEGRQLPIERPPSVDERGREASRIDDMDLLKGLPAYAVVGLRSRVAAAVALTALRQMAESSAPGAFEWAPFASHRGVEVVRIVAREGERELALYYAIAGDALLVTLNRSVMRGLIEEVLAGKLPAQGRVARVGLPSKDGQVVLELAPAKQGAMRGLLGWLLATASLESAHRSRVAAEAILRGVPESAHESDRSAELSRLYLGVAPLTPDGRRYRLAQDGIADPLRGTAHAPQWPAVPTPQSSVELVLSTLDRFRSDLSFDTEPQFAGAEAARLRSLRARLDLRLK